jgi:hypothetical protein
MISAPPPIDLVERLRQHRTLAGVPEAELSWLAARSELRRMAAGDFLIRVGDDLTSDTVGLEVVLSGRLVVRRDRGGGARQIMA